ncbi:MAG: hypothetical protein ACLRWF_03720 [Ruthenibacterium sp.]
MGHPHCPHTVLPGEYDAIYCGKTVQLGTGEGACTLLPTAGAAFQRADAAGGRGVFRSAGGKAGGGRPATRTCLAGQVQGL